MSAITSFLGTFGKAQALPEVHVEPPSTNPLGAFLDKFSGPKMVSFWFYNGTVEIRFDEIDHIYFRVEELGNLVALLNVSTVSHIVDRSDALIPWAAKVAIEKLLRTIPTEFIATGPEDPNPIVVVPTMSLAEFTRIALEAKSAHRDRLEDAGDVGHMAHSFLEEWIKAGLSGKIEEQDEMLRSIGVVWQEL